MLRSPIIVTVGHIDHGKTTLLDAIRGTAVTKSEPGQITQHVGASYVPLETIKKVSGELMKRFNIELDIPGLLFIDTPGHAAFTSLRKRGGSVADLAILVVDVNEGFKEQTYESLKILKEFKVPFVVAATKIDKIPGWFSKSTSFLESKQYQREDVLDDLDKKVYQIVLRLAEENIDSDRFDRVDDFRKRVAIVPVSGLTGEGVSDLLMVLAGLAQQFLKDKLELSDRPKGSILEIKEVRGLGKTIDVILYDGTIKKGDYMIIGGKEPIVTRIKTLLRPQPLKELRIEKRFESIEQVSAAAGIKIVAPNLDKAIPGSPIVFTSDEKKVEKIKEDLKKEIEKIEFERAYDGVIVKADTLGSLEAMVKILTEEGIPIRKAEVGNVLREDLVEAQTVKDKYKRVILVFNLNVKDETVKEAEDLGVKIFSHGIIYRLIEEYKKWIETEKRKEAEQILKTLPRPVELKVIPGAVFRQSKPAVFGVDVLRGVLKPGTLLKRKNGKTIGKVKEIQSEGRTIAKAEKGQRVAISIEEGVIGRNLFEGDTLVAYLGKETLEKLKKVLNYLSEEEKELLQQM